jgi:type I restriction enzyme M protein
LPRPRKRPNSEGKRYAAQETLNGETKHRLGPEAKIRESVVLPQLRDIYGYDISLMRREVPIRFGRRDYFADLVFYTVSNNVKQPFLVVETKAQGLSLDWLQAESYAQRLNAPFFLVTDGEIWRWYRTGTTGPRSSSNLTTEIRPPKIVGGERLVKFSDISDAMKVVGYLHDVIWNEKSSSPEDALRELTKILVAKIIDEKDLSSSSKPDPDFAIKKVNEDPLVIKEHINTLLQKAKNLDSGLFVEARPEVTLRPYSIVKIVEKLQGYTITQTENVELLGEAYQTLLKDTYTEKIMGQRFTPRNVVRFIVELVSPKLGESVYDPACGTGGFLIGALNHVKAEVDEAFERHDLYNPRERITQYAESELFGTDIEQAVIALAKANMILHGDGHTHIIHHDGLIDSEKTKPITQVRAEEGGFDVIMTNPPFGGLKIDPEVIADYELAKNAASELTQVLFIERCTKSLKRGGRMGIILPDGVLSNPKLGYVVDYVKENFIIKAMVSLPKGTFTPYGSDPKTHILFMRRKKFDTERQGDVLVMKVYDIGYTSSGKEEPKKDLEVLERRVKEMGGIQWN